MAKQRAHRCPARVSGDGGDDAGKPLRLPFVDLAAQDIQAGGVCQAQSAGSGAGGARGGPLTGPETP